jgi:hypothetical protein
MATVKLPDKKRVEEWIRGLGAEDFKEREAASEELVRVARVMRPRLLRAARETDSAEVIKRIEELLRRAHKPAAEDLRANRSVEAAEVLASPEAVKILAEWVNGAGGDILTAEAKAALARLRK